jgi:glutathione S-transferase
MNVELYGYQYSVYSWIARLALEEKGASYRWIEINPFAADVPESYLALHPFKRVPALVHDKFQIYETGAITRYIDEAFPVLVSSPPTRAIAPVAASFSPSSTATFTGHWCGRYFPIASFGLALGGRRMLPRYKRVWTQRLCACRIGAACCRHRVSLRCRVSLADIHLAPMIGYFAMAEEGDALLKTQRKLSNWWSTMSARTAYRATMPRLPV